MDSFPFFFSSRELGAKLQTLAQLSNELGRSQPSMAEDEKHFINESFSAISCGPITDNIGRLSDEAILYSLQAAGAALHSIGVLLENGIDAPLTPSVLARTVVENCALLKYLTAQPDLVRRTGRAVNALEAGLKGAGALKPGHPLGHIGESARATKGAMGSIGVKKADRFPTGFEGLVSETLGDFDGAAFYKNLHLSTHHNLVTQISIAARADHDTGHNAVELYDVVTHTARIFISSVESVVQFRAEIPDGLEATVKDVLSDATRFSEYCNYMSLDDKAQIDPE